MKSFKDYLKEAEVQGVEEGHQLPGKDEYYALRNNVWTLYDGDEIVHEYKPERGEIVGAKKLLARFDDEGYDVTHVISPMGVTTYLYGKPKDELDEQVARLAAYNERMAGENPPIDLGLREVGNWAKVGHYGDPIKTAWLNIAKYGVRNNRFKDSVEKVMSAIGEFPDLEDEVYDMYDINQDEVDALYHAYETVYDQYDQLQGQQGMSEGADPGIMVNGKEVDMSSLEVDGVDSRDYPDFSDAYFSAGYFVDGSEMSDQELDQFQKDNGDLLYDKAYDSLHESELNLIKDRAGVNKSEVPAYKRKNSGDPDWKVSHDDLKKEREKSATSPEGLAALKKRMGMIEDGDQ